MVSIDLLNATLSSVDDVTTQIDEKLAGQMACELKYRNNRTEFSLMKGLRPKCKVFWDSLLCWPEAYGNQITSIPCFETLNGVKYDITKNATRLCYANGTWAGVADYSQCKPQPVLPQPEEDIIEELRNVRETSKIFFFGYLTSLIALMIALFIFLYFKELKCMRNRIHTNLIVTYILIDVLWIINFQNPFSSERLHCMLFVFLNYFLTTSYFWMFVEGLYLYMLVMNTFSVDKIPLLFYNIIGFGLPAIFMFIWAPIKYIYSQSTSENMDLKWMSNDKCKWVKPDSLDYIYIAPILIVLLLNIFFMGFIIYVLITKLRMTNSAELQQYRKAAKAMGVLIPLLGANYWFLIVLPEEKTAKFIVLNIRAFLYSTQGLFVAILYCFMNGEVKNCIRNHLDRWRSLRSLYHQNPRHNVTNKGSASSGSTLLNPTIGENDTLDSNDIRTSLLRNGQQLRDFSIVNNSAELRHNLLHVGLFNPE